MPTMQKAVTPAVAAAILEHGFDRVAGYVVAQADAASATTPSDLFRLHALGFAGSPFVDGGPIDLLLFEPAPTMRFENAIGGTTREELQRTGGPFLDRPPFTGTGFAPFPTAVPVWWLVPTRVPAGARLVRVTASGAQVLAEYPDVATGWVVPGAEGRRPVQPSAHVGTYATIDGRNRLADLVGDQVVIYDPAVAGRIEVPRDGVERLFELEIAASWNGLDVRVVAQWQSAGVATSRIAYLGHDTDLAEGLRLVKIEAGVYEATVPDTSLDAVRSSVLEVAGGV